MSRELFTNKSRELNTRINSALLKAIATTQLCHVAPLLALARVVNAKSHIGLSYSTCVEDVQIKDMGSYTVLRILLSTVNNMGSGSSTATSVFYTFRMITASIFEPFVYIGKNEDISDVFVYVDEQESWFSKATGNEIEILEQIYAETLKENKKILARYVYLIKNCFENNLAEDEGNVE